MPWGTGLLLSMCLANALHLFLTHKVQVLDHSKVTMHWHTIRMEMARVYFIVSAVGSKQSQFSMCSISCLKSGPLSYMFIATIIHRQENGRNSFGSPRFHDVSVCCANKAIEYGVVPYKSRTWQVFYTYYGLDFCMSRHLDTFWGHLLIMTVST